MTDLRTAAQQVLEALDGLSEDAVCQSSHHAKKDQHTSLDVCPVFLRLRAAITALKAALAEEALQRLTDVSQEIEAALAEPVQEPVAWRVRGYNQFKTGEPRPWRYVDGTGKPAINTPDCCDFEPLYTTPPQQAEPVQEPVAWIQPDHLQKARVAPFLCRVEPTQRCVDFVPLYTTPPPRKENT